MHNTLEDCISEAIEMVSWYDIPPDEFADAVNDQARLMAGIHPDDSWEDNLETQ